MQASNVGQSYETRLPYITVVSMLLVDTVLYFALSWYLDKVRWASLQWIIGSVCRNAPVSILFGAVPRMWLLTDRMVAGFEGISLGVRSRGVGSGGRTLGPCLR